MQGARDYVSEKVATFTPSYAEVSNARHIMCTFKKMCIVSNLETVRVVVPGAGRHLGI